MIISNTVRFWSYLFLLIPSILCSLFVLYFLLSDRSLRHALNNHVIIVILIVGLICELTDYTWLLYIFHLNGVWERSLLFCEMMGFVDWGLYVTHATLFAWATIERHILIFHDKWVATKKKRFFVHYLPLTFLLMYCLIFYAIFYFFPPCPNYVNYSYLTCIDSCLHRNIVLGMYDTIVGEIIPIFVIFIFSIALLLRILRQKCRMRQPIQWRKQRKMTIQLLAISFLYIVCNLPYAFGDFMNLCGFPSENLHDFNQYAVFVSYLMMLFMPFFCVLSLKELYTKFSHMRPFRRQMRGNNSVTTFRLTSLFNNRVHAR